MRDQKLRKHPSRARGACAGINQARVMRHEDAQRLRRDPRPGAKRPREFADLEHRAIPRTVESRAQIPSPVLNRARC